MYYVGVCSGVETGEMIKEQPKNSVCVNGSSYIAVYLTPSTFQLAIKSNSNMQRYRIAMIIPYSINCTDMQKCKFYFI